VQYYGFAAATEKIPLQKRKMGENHRKFLFSPDLDNKLPGFIKKDQFKL